MKIMTKELFKDLEFHDLIVTLEQNSGKRIPFVFTNGGTECIAKEDLHKVKTNLNVTEKENELSFVLLPDTFNLEITYLEDGKTTNYITCKNDFLLQYLNRLRIISNIPDDILRLIKDKRLLALGYADKETKKEILKYIKSKYRNAFNIYEKCSKNSVEAEEGLTIHEQFSKHPYICSLPFLFDGAKITKAEYFKDEIHLMLNDDITVVFCGAKIIEEEVSILNSCVMDIELYKKQNCYELHFLIMKRDKYLIANYYYTTFEFKDLKFKN